MLTNIYTKNIDKRLGELIIEYKEINYTDAKTKKLTIPFNIDEYKIITFKMSEEALNDVIDILNKYK